MAPASGNVSRPGRALAVLAALIVVLFLMIAGSNLFQPASWHKDFQIHLGLDLTSGTTVSLKAQTPKGGTPKATEMTQALQIMQSRVYGAGFTEAQIQQQGSDVITVSVPGANSQQVVDLVGQTAQLRFRQVLLVAPNTGAAAATPTPSASASATPTPSASSTAKASPSASASSSAHAAGAPGAAGAAGTQEMASRARALPAASASPSASASATPAASASATPSATSGSGVSTVAQATGDASLVSPAVQKLFNKLNCADAKWKQQVGYTTEQFDNPKTQIVACGPGEIKFALDKSKVLGSMIRSANATLVTSSVYWQVNLNFNNAGTAAFGALTTQQFDKYGNGGNPTSPLDDIAVVLDGNVITYPSTNAAIVGGSAQITGNFTQTQATSLANVLSYGALPLTFSKQSVEAVTPTLGRDQLNAGLLAGAIGLILVVVYCLLYYRGLAVVAVSSLVIAATLVLESIIVLSKYYKGFSLNLAGVAGLIVAIGITADSFVVFFERLRDEVREGRTLRTAVERGWKRARRTILVSDTVSFLASALLWYFSIGDVKGFAFTLGLTTLIDVVVVFLFTKPTVTLLARTKFFGQGHRLSGLDPARLGARARWRGSSPRPAVSPARTSAKEA
ncbi:MAG: preprotein translocase subunit SecD [Streptosporangiaceae bacterium]|nr:preprotein translocase subunit SecD [Streptosporangiaceae bacterium]